MTNPLIPQRHLLEQQEVDAMLKRADKIEDTYFRLRSKALVSLFDLTGKRRIEVATLKQEDAMIEDEYLRVTFIVAKKRARTSSANRRTKLLPLEDYRTQNIVEYEEWMRGHHPECEYLFPRTHNIFGVGLLFYPDEHISGRHILRLVKALDPTAWCHLFREKVGASIVKKDPSIIAPFKVMRRLDLESYTTAFNYMRRYAEDIIETEEMQQEEGEEIISTT